MTCIFPGGDIGFILMRRVKELNREQQMYTRAIYCNLN